jgi:hypothetical protein
MNVTRHLIVTLTMLALSGCGEFAYKTGAGADALAADKATCQQAGGDYQTCMHAKGWTISNLGGDDAPEPVAAAPALATSPVVPETVATAPASSAAPAMPASAVPAPADPRAPVKMTAWVRFGGGGPQDDIAACVASLGPGNEPDSRNHTVTRALLACMRGKGWRGL